MNIQFSILPFEIYIFWMISSVLCGCFFFWFFLLPENNPQDTCVTFIFWRCTFESWSWCVFWVCIDLKKKKKKDIHLSALVQLLRFSLLQAGALLSLAKWCWLVGQQSRGSISRSAKMVRRDETGLSRRGGGLPEVGVMAVSAHSESGNNNNLVWRERKVQESFLYVLT